MAKPLRQQIADIDTKISSLQVARAALEAKLGNEVDTDAVQAGAFVTFNYGKAPNVRELRGQVLGRKNAEPGVKGGDFVKVAVGEGFEAQIVTISPGAVTHIHDVQAEIEQSEAS